MTGDKLRTGLMALSKQTGLSMTEISAIARTLAQAEYDPLPPNRWGDVHEWSRRQLKPQDDFSYLSNVPKPDAQVELRRALRTFEEDQKVIAGSEPLTISQLMLAARLARDWFLFWAVRWPFEEGRVRFRNWFEEIEQSLQIAREKAKRRIG